MVERAVGNQFFFHFRTKHVLGRLSLLNCHCLSCPIGYYWIDPNVGNPQDALQVYCSRPGCSCLDCETPDNSAHSQQWPGAKDSLFSSLGHHVRGISFCCCLYTFTQHRLYLVSVLLSTRIVYFRSTNLFRHYIVFSLTVTFTIHL